MSGVSGKKIVPLLYGSALLLCLGLLWYGKMKAAQTPGKDGVPTVEAMAALRALPTDWTRISNIEGQGWVVYVPCGSPQGALRLDVSEDQPSRIACEFCDSLTGARILGFASDGLAGTPEPGMQRFDVDNGEDLRVERVDAKVSARFPGAPLRDYLLTWKISADKALYFVPAEQAEGFETLKAEDESPEGCLGE
jgi:hypothetical protein